MKKILLLVMVWFCFIASAAQSRFLTDDEMKGVIHENWSNLSRFLERMHAGYALLELAHEQMTKPLVKEDEKRHWANVVVSTLHGIGFGGVNYEVQANSFEVESAQQVLGFLGESMPEMGVYFLPYERFNPNRDMQPVLDQSHLVSGINGHFRACHAFFSQGDKKGVFQQQLDKFQRASESKDFPLRGTLRFSLYLKRDIYFNRNFPRTKKYIIETKREDRRLLSLAMQRKLPSGDSDALRKRPLEADQDVHPIIYINTTYDSMTLHFFQNPFTSWKGYFRREDNIFCPPVILNSIAEQIKALDWNNSFAYEVAEVLLDLWKFLSYATDPALFTPTVWEKTKDVVLDKKQKDSICGRLLMACR